ncbi:MAG TPA: ABC transporter permease, partial [Bacteroidetes bacterium]|nr:ABC transporter permease [Bacteroidota bacterium]
MIKDIYRRFKKHKLGVISGVFILFIFIVTGFAEFFAPYGLNTQHIDYMYMPPQKLHFFDAEGRFHFRP